jgi:phosphatidylglycerol lysyltransferase
MRRLLQLRSIPPLTASFLAILLVCAWSTQTIATRLSPARLAQLGCAPADLFSSRAWCTITSIPFTWGGLAFLGLLPLVAASLGPCERVFGARRTAEIFLATHVFARFAEALLLRGLSPALGDAVAASLLAAPDAGPSAGCFGCIGALITRFRPARQVAAAVALALFLAAISFWRPDPGFSEATLWISDLSHPTAALAGYAIARVARRIHRGASPRRTPVA